MTKKIEDFDLTKASQRYLARKAGFDVPLLRPNKSPEFWSQIEKTNTCWFWIGRKDRCGYGVYSINNFSHKAHRYCYEITNNIKIGSLIAMHTCDTPHCVNPDHIKLGTHQDNQHDKFLKNRQAKGSKIKASILKEENVIDAREKYKTGKYTYIDLAVEYGVSKDAMQKAIRGINWGHI